MGGLVFANLPVNLKIWLRFFFGCVIYINLTPRSKRSSELIVLCLWRLSPLVSPHSPFWAPPRLLGPLCDFFRLRHIYEPYTPDRTKLRAYRFVFVALESLGFIPLSVLGPTPRLLGPLCDFFRLRHVYKPYTPDRTKLRAYRFRFVALESLGFTLLSVLGPTPRLLGPLCEFFCFTMCALQYSTLHNNLVCCPTLVEGCVDLGFCLSGTQSTKCCSGNGEPKLDIAPKG